MKGESSHDVFIYEFTVELWSDVVIDVTLLLLYSLCLVFEDGVLVPAFWEAVGWV